MRRRVGLVVCAVALLVGAALTAPAQAEYRSDGGYLEHNFDRATNFGNHWIRWVWEPHFPPAGTEYSFFAQCFRWDDNGFDVGDNKVVFRKGVVTGLDTFTEVKIPTTKGQLQNGVMDWVEREIPALAALAGEINLVEVNVLVKGSLAAEDTVACRMDITEFHDSVAVTTQAQPLRSSDLARSLSRKPR